MYCIYAHNIVFFILTEKESFVSRGLENVSVVQGEDAVFTCELRQATFTVRWAKEDKVIKKSHKYTISQEGRIARLTVHQTSAQDSGEYSCEVVGGAATKATLEIKGRTESCAFPAPVFAHFKSFAVHLYLFLTNNSESVLPIPCFLQNRSINSLKC